MKKDVSESEFRIAYVTEDFHYELFGNDRSGRGMDSKVI